MAIANPIADFVDIGCEQILIFFVPGKNEEGRNESAKAGHSRAIGRHQGVGKDVVGDDHPCPFPVELASRVIRLYSKKGDVVAEPFCGAGTQIIAAEQLGRRCYAMEIEPRYVDVAVARWEAFTGKKARRGE